MFLMAGQGVGGISSLWSAGQRVHIQEVCRTRNSITDTFAPNHSKPTRFAGISHSRLNFYVSSFAGRIIMYPGNFWLEGILGSGINDVSV